MALIRSKLQYMNRVRRIFTLFPFLVSVHSKRFATMAQKTPVTLITFDVDGTLVRKSNVQADTNPHSQAFIHAVGKTFTPNTEFEIKYSTPVEIIPEHKYHGCTDGLILLNTANYAFGTPAAESAPNSLNCF